MIHSQSAFPIGAMQGGGGTSVSIQSDTLQYMISRRRSDHNNGEPRPSASWEFLCLGRRLIVKMAPVTSQRHPMNDVVVDVHANSALGPLTSAYGKCRCNRSHW